jgi:peptidoglycan/LPS O-acetylase OafA/YrhL
MPSSNPQPSPPRKTAEPLRFHGLDTLRGLASVLVVLLHAGIPYIMRTPTSIPWPACEARYSPVVDGAFWSIECFVMPLFFVLSGFFSASLLLLSGPRAFINHRTRRILLPQIAAAVLILPLCMYIWALGWVADGLFVPRSYFQPIPNELEAELSGLGHLWFLQYLYVYCVVLCGASFLRSRYRAADTFARAWSARFGWRLDRQMLSAWKPLLPAIPCAVILYWDLRIVLGYYQTFVPVVSKLLYYAVYFFTGVFIYRHHRTLPLQARYGKSYLAAAALAFVPLLPLVHRQLTAELTGTPRVVLAGLLALFAWLMIFGLFGTFLLMKRGCNAATRYLADASYWVYLVHFPFVGLAQIAVARLPILTPVKFLLAAMITVALSLMTYHVCARYTWVGEFLNGHRRQRKTANRAAAPHLRSSPGPTVVVATTDAVPRRDAA